VGRHAGEITADEVTRLYGEGHPVDTVMSHFRRLVYDYYDRYGRALPWRDNPDPYRVFVSEIMLQQTQVDRVAQKFDPFIARFPSFHVLAAADFTEVLAAWKGLGYNRRALALRRGAAMIMSRWNGVLPGDPDKLLELPGIGSATAASICAFAFNMPVVFLETNIRTVLIHFFFRDGSAVQDRDLFPLAGAALDRKHPSRWYNALMDYGVMLKRAHGNPGRKSRGYRRQSKFEGSPRQVRGLILGEMLGRERATLEELALVIGRDREAVRRGLEGLSEEGFLVRDDGGTYRIRRHT